MKRNFRVYNDAVEFYKVVSTIKLPYHLRNQLLRSASSVALNLAEGAARRSATEQRRFYEIAMGSLRESQAVLDLYPLDISSRILRLSDSLAAQLYRLIQSRRASP